MPKLLQEFDFLGYKIFLEKRKKIASLICQRQIREAIFLRSKVFQKFDNHDNSITLRNYLLVG
jgi:hypothetical protein